MLTNKQTDATENIQRSSLRYDVWVNMCFLLAFGLQLAVLVTLDAIRTHRKLGDYGPARKVGDRSPNLHGSDAYVYEAGVLPVTLTFIICLVFRIV